MNLKAAPGKVIVKFRPYAREGVIIIPPRHEPQSVEAIVVSDGNGEWPEGTEAICGLMDGVYFKTDEDDETRYCTVKRKTVLMIVERDGDKVKTCRPAHRAIIATDEEPEKEIAGGLIQWPAAFEKKRDYGRVLATGPGEWDFSEGATVRFRWEKALFIKIDGEKALLVNEDDVLAVEEAA